MQILGISAFYHDSAAALVRDGEIVTAVQEERFTRKRHDASFPHHAIDHCLRRAEASGSGVDWVAFYDKPFLKFERLLETYLSFAPRGFESFRRALPVWLREKLFQKSLLEKQLKKHADIDWAPRLLFSEHHQSHAASAYYPSPFDEAVVLTMDGVGEWATTSVAMGSGRDLRVVKELHFPHSLGLLYSAFTYYTGFKVNSGEYKVMGLAPYGEPRYVDRIFERLVDLKPDGSFRLDMRYFDYCTGLRMTNDRFHESFGGPPRRPDEPITQRTMDLAASVQAAVERVVVAMTDALAAETGCPNLCLAGGVALNCVANGKVLRRGRFDRLWIQPAAGDAGGAIGAALTAHHHYLGRERAPRSGVDGMKGAYLGPSFDDVSVRRELDDAGARYETMSEAEVSARTARALADGLAVGWFQGRMEFGPRALGNRSILADPRSPKMQSQLNLKVKKRESFRPFAPAILREALEDWFELDRDSPYMLLVAEVAKKRRREMTPTGQARFGIDELRVTRSDVPAVTHVDYSARVQTVHADTNPRFHRLLRDFRELTGCPVLVNTSFNIRGEPIVCRPTDAFRCFMGTDLDVLVVGSCFLTKSAQDAAPVPDHAETFEPD